MSEGPDGRPNPLLGLLRRQPRPEPGHLACSSLSAEWDGEHLSLTPIRDGELDDEPLRLVSGEPLDALLSAITYPAGESDGGESADGEPLAHQLHAEVQARGELFRLCAPAPLEVVGDLPLRNAFGDAVELDALVGLLRQLAALGARLRVPRIVETGPSAPPGLDLLGTAHQRELVALWDRVRSEPTDLDAFQRLEIIYGANGLWRPLCKLYDEVMHPHGRERLIAILDRIGRLYDDGPELSHLWLTIGLEIEAAGRTDHARLAYFRSFKAWAQNVAAIEAKLALERREGDLVEYRKMREVRRKVLLGYAGASVAYLKLAVELLEADLPERAEYLVRLAARLPSSRRRRRVLDTLVGWVKSDRERALRALHQLTDGIFDVDDDEDDESRQGDGSDEPALRLVTPREDEDEDDEA